MSRARVFKDPITRDWIVSVGDWEYDDNYHSWRESLNQADRLARTVEVVLPRATYGDKVVAGKGLYSVHVNHREHCTDINLGGWDGVTIENRHLRVLGAYLYALGEATR